MEIRHTHKNSKSRSTLFTPFTRLSVSLTLVFLFFSLLLFFLLVRSSRHYEMEVSQRLHKDLAQFVIDHYLLFKDGEPDLKAAKKTFHDLMILGPNFEFYLLDTEGNVLAFSAKPDKVKRKKVDTLPFEQWRKTIEKSGYVTADDPRKIEGKKVFSVAPIMQEDKHYGYLYTVIGSQLRDELKDQLSNSQILSNAVTILLVGLMFALLMIILIVARVTYPISRLSKQVRQVRDQGFSKNDGNFPALIQDLRRWRGDSRDDIHNLGFTLRTALEKLQEQYSTVVSVDELRKELLSHMSHDLRTPLSSLLGYLETWEMQQDKISPDQSSEYIAIARRSAEKIANLVEQLFELAHLDGDNVPMSLETFSIAELVQDVLQKFKISAQKKSIALEVIPQDSSIVVRADIEKMERVFINLVENALRHTPEGGKITVNIDRTSDLVSIQVMDTGIGIPEQDLPFIFDAHYKAGNSVRENTAHGGLGLAITKKLLELHQTVIEVKSQLNHGTSFRFALATPGQ